MTFLDWQLELYEPSNEPRDNLMMYMDASLYEYTDAEQREVDEIIAAANRLFPHEGVCKNPDDEGYCIFTGGWNPSVNVMYYLNERNGVWWLSDNWVVWDWSNARYPYLCVARNRLGGDTPIDS